MKFSEIHTVYFIGIGGIGMSALARYFKSQGKVVSGYDKTETELTVQLVKEGIPVHYTDLGDEVLKNLDKTSSLIIYTPAVPKDHGELNAFIRENYNLIKRAKALGIISSELETFAVAGTHGKTTTSTLLSWVLNNTIDKCNAFVGGISSNFNSNTLIEPNSKRVVVEADEFDRSFLQLDPDYAIVTSMDADHLDIYGDGSHLLESFRDFMNCVDEKGLIVINANLDLTNAVFSSLHKTKRITYGTSSNAQWKAINLRYENERFFFDIQSPQKEYQKIELGIPGAHNCENATAVFALLSELNFDEETIRKSLASFKGVQRRFDFQIRRNDLVVIDDYAHHPTEIEAFLSAVKKLYPAKKITAVFQPHLFSRTRDFMDGFAKSLSICDELFLLDIYPARELPIPGITSEVLLQKVTASKKQMSTKQGIVADLKKEKREVIVIIGAGDIDTCVKPIRDAYQ
ncbi:MAG: UDP-N-acetylmuramate--L-alanine ligase [Crocinitomicaceae bacterium]|nr:UDP-N-acetylmuramate--L-alanine ligase [Crocinitomicaceae bacterium]